MFVPWKGQLVHKLLVAAPDSVSMYVDRWGCKKDDIEAHLFLPNGAAELPGHGSLDDLASSHLRFSVILTL